MILRAATLVLILSLPGCGKVAGLLLGGGGPKVAANIQAGKTNSQTVGSTQITEQRFEAPEQAQTLSQTGTVQTTNNNIAPWAVVLIAFLSGILIPRPQEVADKIRRAMQRKRRST